VVDGHEVSFREGQSVAGALHAAGVRAWRRNAVSGELRGPYCGMGVCFECELTVDERSAVRACMVEAVDGMHVTTEMSCEVGDVKHA
jgi:hypothetical protein